MKFRTILFVSLALLEMRAHTQTVSHPLAAPSIGLGAYSLNHVDAFSFTSNQACLAQIKSSQVGLYSERRFMLSDLSGYHVALGVVTRSGNFGLNGIYFGSLPCNETKVGLAYARKLGSGIDIGLQFDYNGLRLAGYANTSALTFQGGVIFHLSEKLHTGFHAYNPLGGKWARMQQEKLPSIYTFGLGYDASENFFFSAEVIKEENQHINIDAGLKYKFIPQVLLTAGISSATSSIWFGWGTRFRSLWLDITASYHPQLGFSPGLILLFNFKRKNNLET